MAKYRNNKALKAIGEKIVEERQKQNFEISDIADQASLSYNTVAKIENGQDALLSSFIEVCFALNLHPKKILEVELNVRPRNKLSPSRKEKSRLTTRVRNLIERGHFESWQGTNNIVEKLQEHFDLIAESKNVSSILRRLSSENFLKVKKEGRKNLYIVKK
jgi:transcriptional regulator with XRE-family HTH domain